LFEHAQKLLNLIGHGVVKEGHRKLTGCLQTFGGHCIEVYTQFSYIGENLKVDIFLSPDFAKCRPYVIRIRIKWLTGRFNTDAFTDEMYPDTNTDDKNSPNVI